MLAAGKVLMITFSLWQRNCEMVKRDLLPRQTVAAPAEVTAGIKEGRPVVVVARNSGATGRAAHEAAVQDLSLAMERLAGFGLDFRHLMASDADLVKLLKSAKGEKSRDPSGGEFVNRFVDIDLTGSGLYVILSAGSGRKITDGFAQPFVDHVVDTVIELDPILLFARRIDRLTRSVHTVGRLLQPLQHRGAFIGDAAQGIRKVNLMESMSTYFQATMAQAEVDKLPTQTREGMARNTGDTLVAGQVSWGVAGVPPPGFGRARLLDGVGRRDRTIIYLETEGCRPDPATISDGGSQVVDAAGNLVDQVDNVRFALSVIGKSGWSLKRVGEELIARRFSTDGIRRRNGVAAYFDDSYLTQTKAQVVVSAIIKNLDMYRTGVYTAKLGVPDVDDVDILDMVPLDGPWAQPSDFERIEAWKTNNRTLFARRRSMAFAGMHVTVNGQPCTLFSYQYNNTQGIRFNLDDLPHRTDQKVPDGSFPIPYDAFAQSVIQALATIGDRDVDVFPRDTANSKELHDLTNRLRQMETGQADRIALRDSLFGRLTETNPDGQLTLRGALLDRVQDEYNETDRHIEASDPKIAAAKRQLASAKAAAAHENQTSRLLRAVASLKDPHDTTLASFWSDVITDLVFTSTRSGTYKERTKVVSWEGTLRLSVDDGEIRIPITGNWIWRASWRKSDNQAHPAIDAMRAGIPFPHQGIVDRQAVSKEICEILGINGRAAMVLNCEDPTIVAAVLSELHPTEDEATIDPQDAVLRSRLRDLYTTRKSSQWRIVSRRDSALSSLYARATQNGGLVLRSELPTTGDNIQPNFHAIKRKPWVQEWEFTTDGARLNACSYCKETSRAPSEILEPVGSICLNCRKDRAGITWPEKPYNQYLCTPQQRATRPTQERAATGRKKQARTMSELTEHEIANVLVDYRNLRKLIQGPNGILETHNITNGTLYRIIDTHNEPKRHNNRSSYWNDHPPDRGAKLRS